MWRKSILLTLSAVLLGTMLTGVVQAQTASLAGWWKFDETAGTTAKDSSSKKHNGTLVGAPKWVAGRTGGALSLGGTDYAQVGYAADLGLNDFTVFAWVNLASEPVESGVLGTRAGAENTFDFKVEATQIHGDVGTGGTWLNTALDITATDTGTNGQGGDLKLGTWYALAYVIDYTNQQVRLYIDGDLKKTIAISGKPLLMQSGQTMQIGGTGYTGEGMKGLLDDVMLFSRALKTEQVAGLMNGTIPVWNKSEKPNPADGTTGVTVPLLQWVPGETATYVDVYLGTSPDLKLADRRVHQSALVKMYYALMPPLTPGQKYYWRVDSVDGKGQLIAAGDVWSFTMAPLNAYNPIPANGAKYQDPNVDLTWSPGQNAYTHDVYFSTNKDDVVNRIPAALLSSQPTAGTVLPLMPMETTYYWCVDETEALGAKHAGDVWSFTTTLPGLGAAKRELWRDAGAGTLVSDLTNDSRYPNNPTDVNEMPDFESPAAIADNYGGKLSAWVYVPIAGEYTFWVASDDCSQLFLGTDSDSAVMIASVDGWTNVQDYDKFAGQKSQPILLDEGRYYLMALWKDGADTDNCSAAWQGPGIPNREVIHGNYLMPFEALWAYGPRPRNDVNEVTQTPLLTWTAGTRAATHQVYFSDDEQAVIAGDSAAYRGEQALDETSFEPGVLEFGKTYYWRVDEVNPAEADSPWKGAVWSFTTADFIVVDSFEDYTDETTGRIFQTWIDGWGYTEPAPGNPGNGTSSTVGYTSAPFAETTLIHGGRQAMPFDYNNVNSPYYSETDRTWTTAQNWTVNGMNTLSLWFRGYPVRFADDGTTITMSAAGDDIWNAADAFRFAYKKLSGDGSITAKVNSLVQTDVWAKAGVMIRESLAVGSANAANIVSAASGVSFQWRGLADGTCANTGQAGLMAPYWVRLTRTGNTFKAEASADNKTWSIIGTDAALSSTDVPMMGPVYIGLCVTSHNTNAKLATTAVFSDVKTTGGVSGQWQVADIGMTHPGNDPAQLYVAVQDGAGKTAVVKHPDLNAVQATEWAQWQIPLTQFTGVNTKTIKKMFIGVGDRVTPQAGGVGKLFIDDVRVIKP